MRSKKSLPPETLVYTGRYKEKTTIHHIQYDEKGIRTLKNVEVHPRLNDWILFQGLEDVQRIKKVCERFSVDPLVIEDILNVHQRNKVEIYENYLFSVKKFAYIQEDTIHHEYISMLLFEDKLITFQERKTTFFDSLIERLKSKVGNITRMGHDYLYYVILDTIVDENIAARKMLSNKIMILEQEMSNLDSTKQISLYNIRKELLFLKNSNRQMLLSFSKQEYKKVPLIKENIHKYFEDLSDHIVRLDENIEIERELLSNLLDVQMSNVSNKMNHIMTVLTIFSATFIPLSFLSGVFGMNFVNFPILRNEYGLLIFLSMCILVAGFMLLFFKRKKWL